jgi:hypothetical protein
MSEAILKAIEDEIANQVNAKLSKYIERVSKRHGIPLKLLLEDVAVLKDVKDTQCKGVVKGGTRCKRRGAHDGYCGWHLSQKKQQKVVTPAPVDNVVRHTHPVGKPLFLKGCPACERTSSNKQNLLIDM